MNHRVFSEFSLSLILPFFIARSATLLLLLVLLVLQKNKCAQLTDDLASLLWNKRGLSHRVRVELTGRPPEHATETVVQRIIKVAEEEASPILTRKYFDASMLNASP